MLEGPSYSGSREGRAVGPILLCAPHSKEALPRPSQRENWAHQAFSPLGMKQVVLVFCVMYIFCDSEDWT